MEPEVDLVQHSDPGGSEQGLQVMDAPGAGFLLRCQCKQPSRACPEMGTDNHW